VGLIIFMLIYKIPSFTHWRTCVHIIFAHLDKRKKRNVKGSPNCDVSFKIIIEFEIINIDF
jgi:hypothetical protein